MPTTDKSRDARVEWSSDSEKFLLRRMSGQESLGRLGQFELELLSEDGQIDLDAVLASSMAVRLNEPSGETRYFHGHITRFSLSGSTSRFYTYQARLDPWFWFLTRSADCRIFQDLSAVDIIKEIFGEYRFADYENRLDGDYPPIDYCVQYRETTYNFISRLMEQWGIYYYFEHHSDHHVMVLCDSPGAHLPTPGYEALRYKPSGTSSGARGETVREWTLNREVQTGEYALRAFDFENTTTSVTDSLEVRVANPRTTLAGEHKKFDYPGLYTSPSRELGRRFARQRLEAEQVQFETVRGASEARGLFPGGLFKLTEHTRNDQNREYLTTGASYEYFTDDYDPEGNEITVREGPSFDCQFAAAPSAQEYRSPRSTTKPVVQGPQTAIVVGKAGEELWTDKFGRIRIQFHWDRQGKRDENSTCWVRVSQSSAGKQWGAMFIPRVGHEVVVSFLEGDPDRPIVTGSVYNSETMPPYELPANATMSTIKSNSSKGGDGYNEIRFEDKKDDEQIFVHAEKNARRVVENNDELFIGMEKKDPGDQAIRIHNDQTIDIGNMCHMEAGKSIELVVGSSSIKIEPSQITIKATKLLLSGQSSVEISSGGTLKMSSGATMDISAGAILTAKGAVVKIN